MLKLEAIIDALESSKQVIYHNRIETELVVDRIITYQLQYHKLFGHYYNHKSK